ncbi:hypothetical protein CDAR_246101 [Caerostris darwini]|uniref:Uncharacterized protein n=1 Tax=Caerostris darwini TaxID=1538125 RepID=A0AAV4QPT2_9ARAC|nr:hypothetical protein CDAR_246101 [Caerostris darwini]
MDSFKWNSDANISAIIGNIRMNKSLIPFGDMHCRHCLKKTSRSGVEFESMCEHLESKFGQIEVGYVFVFVPLRSLPNLNKKNPRSHLAGVQARAGEVTSSADLIRQDAGAPKSGRIAADGPPLHTEEPDTVAKNSDDDSQDKTHRM